MHVSGVGVASLLDAATSLHKFALGNINMEAFERNRSMFALTAALKRNTSVETFILMNLEDEYLLPILASLGGNSHFSKFIFSHTIASDRDHLEASNALGHLLTYATNIREFIMLVDQKQEDPVDLEETFRPIAQGLIDSKSITEITLSRFYDDYPNNGLEKIPSIIRSILELKSNLRSFSMQGCQWDPRREPEPFLATFVNLLRPESSLRSLELSASSFRFFNLFSSTMEFETFLRAVETSPLEHFNAGFEYSYYGEQYRALIQSIPKMQLRTLHVSIHSFSLVLTGHLKNEFIEAVKRNATLQRVGLDSYKNDCVYDCDVFDEQLVFVLGRRNQLDENDHRRLDKIAARNQGLASWIKAPGSLPTGAWMNALAMVQKAGLSSSTVFSILRQILPPIADSFCDDEDDCERTDHIRRLPRP